MSANMGNGDLLRASRSPQTLGRGGVRRLNHIPLFICGAIALVVAALVARTAAERGKVVPVKTEDHGGNAHDFAVAVAGDRTGYIAPAHGATSSTPPPPAVNAAEPVPAATPAPTQESAPERSTPAMSASDSAQHRPAQCIRLCHQPQRARNRARSLHGLRLSPLPLCHVRPLSTQSTPRPPPRSRRK